MAVTKTKFGMTDDGREVFLYTLEGSRGMKASVMNFGAILVNLYVPDQNGDVKDIVLGYDSFEPYKMNGCFFGATIGPSANRIAGAQFVIGGTTYKIPANENGNNLHSDFMQGWHKQLWDAEELEDGVKFTLKAADGDLGFPGNREVSVTYVVTKENELKLIYHGTSDKKTVLNLTNHTYFNLKGQDSGKILDHVLWLKASRYTPVVPGAIPTGELAPVKDTVFDFTVAKEVGRDIEADEQQLKLTMGYDHNFVIDDYEGKLQKFATVTAGGRTMEVYTDLPGVQFYAGNCIAPHAGKGGAAYGPRCAMCLETQAFPDSANRAGFPNVFFGDGLGYNTTTVYKFL